MCINTLYKGDSDDNYDNNNNNNNNIARNGDHSMQEAEKNKLKIKIMRTRKETHKRIRPYRWSGAKGGGVL
jgi:hypothetical protein